MKTKLPYLFITLALWSAINLQPVAARAQGTAFTYQGRLISGTNAANGSYDLSFGLFGSNAGGHQVGGTDTITNSPVNVSNGLFTVTLDFGTSAFPGPDRWLEIAVRTNGNGGFTTLTPRQQLTPIPYAITAANVIPGAGLSGTYGGVVTLSNLNNYISGTFIGNGANVMNVNAATLGGLGGGSFWQLGGNANTGGASLGPLDSQPLKLVSGNARVLLLETKVVNNGLFNNTTTANVLGGAGVNAISNSVIGATIGGGGSSDQDGFVTTPHPNTVLDAFGTVGGGLGNTAGSADADPTTARAATVGGGENNGASGNHSFIGGGSGNGAVSASSAIAGGAGNGINDLSPLGPFFLPTVFADASFIGGGLNNVISASASSLFSQHNAYQGVIGGGLNNAIAGASYAAIPGGRDNAVNGDYGLAAGHRAKANHAGAFVWGDSTDADFASTAANQFAIRATGGVMLSDSTPNVSFGSTTRQMLNLWGTQYGIGIQGATLYFRVDNVSSSDGFSWYKGGTHDDNYGQPGPGGVELMHLVQAGLYVNGTFVSASDRNVKQDFAEVNSRAVLEKVAQLPIQTWAYTNDPGTKHLGPVAQDFYAAFNIGPDDKHITTVDESGVALAAIQGLNQKLQSELNRQDSENAKLKQQNELLFERLNELEMAVKSIAEKK
jgi:trimeric autotransporter adhesin